MTILLAISCIGNIILAFFVFMFFGDASLYGSIIKSQNDEIEQKCRERDAAYKELEQSHKNYRHLDGLYRHACEKLNCIERVVNPIVVRSAELESAEQETL